MDKEGGGKGFTTILCLFLIVSLPLLLYQNNSSNSVWSFRTANQTIPWESPPNGTVADVESSSSQVARNHSVAVAPTATDLDNHKLDDSKNVSSPSISPISFDPTVANSTKNSSSPSEKSQIRTIPNSSTTENKLLNGLLPVGFDAHSCLSRYESHLYRKASPHKPSPRLLSKLRRYERLHRRCGPKSREYSRALRKLTRTKQSSRTINCNYIAWFPVNGLGNRMISLAATFLYAVLTNRVLLVAFEAEMSGVFCEPFLNSTWKLPRDFPYRHHIDDLPTYEHLIERKNHSKLEKSMDVPPFLYVHLQHYSHERERYFHCGEGQTILKRVPFLLLRSDQYFVPSLFMIPSFKEELNAMFPEKDTVFHHLGRYLFSPSNEAWSQITGFYKAKLSKADKKVGIQVRVFAAKLTPPKTVTEQILACTQKSDILPRVNHNKDASKNETSMVKAVLVTSLYKEYSESLRAIYKTGRTTTGEVVRVYQPSHEEVQRFNDNSHHVKALTEMYLLSLCDELVTSGESTFGYVAQSLGAMKPWIMYKTVGNKFRDPPCEKALSMEPCFHFPPRYDCERKIIVEHISSVFPHMRRCEDLGTGVKMVSKA